MVEADAAELLVDPVEVARRSLTFWEDSELDDAEVTKEVAVIGASDSLVVVAFLVVVSASVVLVVSLV